MSAENTPRLLIAAGGTGGHIYPGLAVAREFADRYPNGRVLFVGTSRGLEEKIITPAGFEVRILRAEPLRGGTMARKIKGVLALFPALLDAHRLLAEVRPGVVVGVGGYISGPLLLAASMRRIPTLIMEPNFDPGLANKWLARFVDAAAVAWEDTATYFRGKAFVAGNPVRTRIAAVADVDASLPLGVLLFGGSQGSRALNDAMVAALPLLTGGSFRIVHQTGPTDLDRIRAAYEKVAEATGSSGARDARIEPYLPRMDEEYAAAAIVVARAGATTCAELAACGRGALLVPLELAGGHQRHNAEALRAHGAAEVLYERDLSGESIAEVLNRLAADPACCAEMGQAARRQAKPDAAKKIVDRLEELLD